MNDEYTVSVRLTENLSDVSMNETYNMNISALNNTIEEARGEDVSFNFLRFHYELF